VDDDGTGGIEFSEFLKLILNQKTQAAERADEKDTVDAFIAMGGSSDKSGVIKTEKLVRIISEFELKVDIPQLLNDADKDKSGFIDYQEFFNLLNT
jgi:Ca2+-binding EF-hand superfamily protein